MRSLLLGLVIILTGAGTAAEQPLPPEGSIPELIVFLTPAEGMVPVDLSDRFVPYRSWIVAVDQESRHSYGSVQMLVRFGQKRSVDRGSDDSRIRGWVDLQDDGLAKYRAELILRGRTMARTSATVRVASSK
jgi:hypothetical protein